MSRLRALVGIRTAIVLSINIAVLTLPFGRRMSDWLDLRATDVWVTLRPPRGTLDAAGVVLVETYCRTLQPVGRREVARLLTALRKAGARTIALDLIFRGASSESASDAKLARTLRRYRDIVVVAAGAVVVEGPRGIGRYPLVSNRMFEGTQVGLANVGLTAGAVRRFPAGGEPSDPRPLSEVAAGDSRGWRTVPEQSSLLNFYRSPDRIQYCHAVKAGRDDPRFRDKIVFVGDPLEDVHPIPGVRYRPVPGMVIHATATANLLDGTLIQEPNGSRLVCAVILCCLALSFRRFRIRPEQVWKWVVGAALAGSTISFAAYLQAAFVPALYAGLVGVPLLLLAARSDRAVEARGRHHVFISYRQNNGAAIAGRLAEGLRDERPFLDVESGKPGRLDLQLLKRIEETPNFIVVLSPGSLDPRGDATDWMRLEIEKAFDSGRNIIPVLQPGFEFPPDDTLGQRLALYPGERWDEHFASEVVRRVEAKLISPWALWRQRWFRARA